MLREKLQVLKIDDAAMSLIDSFLRIKIKYENNIQVNRKGIVQGSSLSPLLSNLFLSDLDHMMERKSVAHIRFSDDIKIFSSDLETAVSFKYKISRKKIR